MQGLQVTFPSERANIDLRTKAGQWLGAGGRARARATLLVTWDIERSIIMVEYASYG